jgi:hypothetical protein
MRTTLRHKVFAFVVGIGLVAILIVAAAKGMGWL